MRWPAAAALLLLTACGTGSRVAGGVLVDSVDLACETIITPGDNDEGVIGRFAPGPDGLLAWIPDRRPVRVSVGRAANAPIQIGRRGEGPGEFGYIGGIGWIGDTLWVTDLMQPRIQYFDRGGALLGQQRVTEGSGWRPTPDGRLRAIAGKPIGQAGWTLTRLGGDSASPTTESVFDFPGPEESLVELQAGGGRVLVFRQPFSAFASANAAANASKFCGTEPLDADNVRLRCVDPDGAILRDTVLSLAPLPVTDSIWESTIARFVTPGGPTRQDITSRMVRGDVLPRVTGLLIDDDNGTVWIRRSHSSDPLQRWMRLAADGTLRDTLHLTRGDIRHLAGDTLWRVVTDDDGIQSVERCVP